MCHAVVLQVGCDIEYLAGDEEGDRKIQAEVLLNVYGRELERLRLTAGARGWSIISERGNAAVQRLFGVQHLSYRWFGRRGWP